MKIAIIYTTSNKSTKKSCNILAGKINGDVKLVSVKNAKTECILKYDFIILAASTINGKVQSELKIYISRNIKTLKEKPIALITNCEENKNMFNSITNSVSVENQNQHHNAKKASLGPNTKR